MPDTLMTDAQPAAREKRAAAKKTVAALVGNPNCGKTTLFNALTGMNQKTGNWPGVTVDRKTGSYVHDELQVELVDLPGVYSMTAASVDEEIARSYILSKEAGLIVNIVDASNLERNLYLTSRLLEMNVPVLVALNMMDVAAERGLEIDVNALEKRLGCRVVPLVASRNKGVDALKIAVSQEMARGGEFRSPVVYPPPVAGAIEVFAEKTAFATVEGGADPAWFAVKLLEGDSRLEKLIAPALMGEISAARKKLSSEFGEDLDIIVADSHYRQITSIVNEVVKRKREVSETVSDRIDKVVLSRIWGIPVFLFAVYAMFLFTINLGGAFIDFFDIVTATIFVDGFTALLMPFGAPEWLVTILASGLGGSLQTMATFIPPIGFMFLFLSFLEDSGYMARAAFVMDRGMRFLGLPGKAFIPLLVGFGCNVPAIMGARTIENQRDRLMTIMMAPFMSCGARMPVYALFAAAFFPVGGQNIVFLLYLIGIGFAALTGLVLKNTLLQGEASPFIMELPPYHVPTFKGVLLRTWDRLQSFLVRAGKILVPVIVVLSFFNSLGTDGSFGNEDTETSVLASVGKTISPVFAPMGVTEENWPATVGIFTGIFAKEAVVGTLDAMYSQIGSGAGTGDAGEKESGFNLVAGISEAFATIPANLADLSGAFLDPLGISIGDVSDIETAAEEQEVDAGIFGSMVKLFDGKIGAFAYLLFVLLYFPCVAAIAAVYRETNLGWTIFAGLWTTGLAYIAAVIFYQLGNVAANPSGAVLWTGAMLVVFAAAVAAMRFFGRKSEKAVWPKS
ncbi:ferrous iron transport protein B [Prosthecochloris sp. GSB1]|uniref:Fe(2+) transporter permease subunit FeoB n=1 Tax=Prosthecochloris sp. GSB1 TaxID=281093 RepID=UPI000B8CA503|nr:Fe(2+) transporter permease subunit FeoB [Prosthecochloris sp. GSB1]ASQ91003.1 ferrous iron transport protein B [Prosthecochloris sp. GSB1]